MPAWFSVLFWWLAFAGTHVLLSSRPVRRPLIERVGARGFQGIYSLVALATFIPLVRAFWRNRHAGPVLWALGSFPGMHALSIALSEIGFVLLVLAFMQPSPTGMVPAAALRAHGVTRITRHPFFAGLGLWGLAHSLVNGLLIDVIFFGGFLVFGLVGGRHQDARKQRTQPDALRAFYGETSMLPFAAIVTGRNRLVLGELPWLGVLIGLAVATTLYLLHPRLFLG